MWPFKLGVQMKKNWFGLECAEHIGCHIARFLFEHLAANAAPTPSAATPIFDVSCIRGWFWCCWPTPFTVHLSSSRACFKVYGEIIPPHPGPAPNLPPIPSSSSTSSPKSIFGNVPLRSPLRWKGSKFPLNLSFLRLRRQRKTNRVKIIKSPVPR